MERRVIGAGYFFLASGCTPVLTTEQKRFLQTVKPDEFYPMKNILDIFSEAKKKDPRLLSSTGKKWGSALKEEFTKQGIRDIVEALQAISALYLVHHQGDVGTLDVKKLSNTSIELGYSGPYPMEFINGAYEGTIFMMKGKNITIEPKDEKTYLFSWSLEE